MLDAVLLDWENVLVDTADARRHALRRALSEEGVRYAEPADVAAFEWQGFAAEAVGVLQRAGTVDPTLADIVVARATTAFAERLGKGFVLRQGAREVVERIQASSRLAIVTTATRSETEFMLRLAGLEAAASTIVSADDSADAPPSPDGHRRAVAQLARRRPLHPERVVALVGTHAFLRAARDANVRTVALGMPAHVAVEADGALTSLIGVTVADLERAAGIPAVTERQS
ncbi:MAG: HAD family phosphatase [Gemmatimonadaceae bacterium]